ncbi:pyrroline-5-carboxylate reductase [Niveomyces insectorum RCEF 264]|uniref:Pyrroline-5-carboxylate reductase n=1 Tax=Niveomyces insectorum RCEF 264 TaxID=1081102 RepID=A0A167N2Q2_9HYPO|nr:pyrroline-5-carboxylate reductase [Niveomyces insectorum RCEF 264]
MASIDTAKLAFIGGGNMAGAIIGGLLARGIPPTHITVAEPYEPNRTKLAERGVHTTTDNGAAARGADLVVLAVKPQVAQTACGDLVAAWGPAGETASALPLVPARVDDDGTPALVGEGAAGLYAPAGDGAITTTERQLATALLQSVSKAAEWVDKEELLDVVTGLSGSGPAYFFAMVEHLIDRATALGLPREQASRLAKQTCLGAGKMLVESSDDAGQLRKNVTSPNGTTHAALVSLEKDGFAEIVGKAVEAATTRATELGKTA